VIDTYSPDYIWFDFGLDFLPEGYVKDFLAYYYNHAEANGKEVLVTYKTHDLVPGSGLLDHELGQEPQLTYHEWITDSTVDDRGAWGYADDLTFKTPNRVIDNLVDRVSKNGYLLLNVGVIRSIRAESMLQSDEDPEAVAENLSPLAGKTFTLGGSTWAFGEDGKVLISEGKEGGSTSGRYEQDGTKVYVKIAFITFNASYDGENFTISQDEERVAYHPGFYREEIKRISLLGHGEDLEWSFTRSGLIVDLPDEPPGDHAHVLKIERHHHPPIE
jgi:alpha-L-fucosidase